jgi:hypothetical protein
MIVRIDGRKFYALKQEKGTYRISADNPAKSWTDIGYVQKTRDGKWKVQGMKGKWDTMRDAVQNLIVNQPVTGPLFGK